MKRVLQIVTDMNMGGIETLLMDYYRHIDRSLVQFDFLVHRPLPSFYEAEILSLGGRIFRVPPIRPKSFLLFRKELSIFFKTHSYEIIHAHNNAYSMFALREAKKNNIPVRIANSHCAFPKLPFVQHITYEYCRKTINHYCTHRYACSKLAGQWLFSQMPFRIMPNAIQASSFTFSQSIREDIRTSLGVENCLLLMHVGRMVYPKNHAFLLEVFAEVLKSEPSAKLLLVGDGELREEIENKANDLLPTGSVHFLGTRTDVAELLQAADVFLFPSRFEGLGITLIEAQAAGLPCIKSDTVTDECVVTDLVTSLPITDPTVWAKEALRLRSTPRKDQSEAIRKSGYDIETAAQKLECFYLHGEPL